MNATERDQLQRFLSDLRQTRAAAKDPLADQLIRDAIHAQADAPYLLVQRTLGLSWALDAAQARIQQLEVQCAQLGATQPPQQHQSVPTPAAAANRSWLSNATPTSTLSTWGGGMVAQVATTAAGVMAGGLLLQGLQSLMGHSPTSPASNALSPAHNAPDGALSDQLSPQASADGVGDSHWGAGEDWA